MKLQPKAVARFALLLCATTVTAQTIDSGALQRQQQPAQAIVPPPREVPPVVVESPVTDFTPTRPAGSVFVTDFTLALPSALLAQSELTTLLKEFKGRENTFPDLLRAAARVADALRGRGYTFARVIVPQQEVVGGVVALEIVPGRLSTLAAGEPDIRVNSAPGTRLDEQRAKKIMIAALTDPGALNTKEIERGLLLLNDLPGINGSGVILPGAEPGTLALGVNLQEAPLFGGWADLDNYGSRATGSARVAADLHVNDLRGRGDAAELYLAKTSGTESATVSFSDPIGVSGLSARLAASFLHYRLSKEFSALDANGNSVWVSGGLSEPLLRSRSANFYWTATLDYKRLRDSAGGSNLDSRYSQALSAGIRGDFLSRNEKGSLAYWVVVTGGRLNRDGNAGDATQDSLTRRTQGSYAILRSSTSWLQEFNSRWSYYAAVQTQFTSRNLDSSEKMYMGGPHGVRAYPLEEAGSDSGQALSLELRYQMFSTPKWGGQIWTPFALVDVAHITSNERLWRGWNFSNPDLRNSYVLKGWGLGLRAQIARRAQFEFVVARKIGTNPGTSPDGLDADGRAEKIRLWALGAVSF